MAPHLTKGSLITVEGQQMEPSTWIGKDGEAHAQIVIVANFIDFVRAGRKKEDAGDNQTSVQGQPVMVEAAQNNAPFPAPEDNKDDLPF